MVERGGVLTIMLSIRVTSKSKMATLRNALNSWIQSPIYLYVVAYSHQIGIELLHVVVVYIHGSIIFCILIFYSTTLLVAYCLELVLLDFLGLQSYH